MSIKRVNDESTINFQVLLIIFTAWGTVFSLDISLNAMKYLPNQL